MAKKVIIFGTGGNCIDILDTINEINLVQGTKVFECLGFLDDDKSKWGKEYFGVKVIGGLEAAKEHKDAFFVNGIGSPNNFWKKEMIIAKAGIPLERFENIIHPTASVSKMVKLGRGVVVFQNVTITSNANIGNHVIILPNTVISHDDIIGDYTCITGGVCISGGVKVGKACYIGTNSAINANTTIGDNALIGMGAVVLKDVPENTVVVGNPAKFLRKTVK